MKAQRWTYISRTHSCQARALENQMLCITLAPTVRQCKVGHQQWIAILGNASIIHPLLIVVISSQTVFYAQLKNDQAQGFFIRIRIWSENFAHNSPRKGQSTQCIRDWHKQIFVARSDREMSGVKLFKLSWLNFNLWYVDPVFKSIKTR